MSKLRDPQRLLDATPPSPLGELFASAANDVPSDQQLAALAERLGPVLDAPPGPAAPHAPSGLLKLGLATGAAALLVGGLIVARQWGEPSSRVPSARLPSPAAPALQSDASAARASNPTPAEASAPAAAPPLAAADTSASSQPLAVNKKAHAEPAKPGSGAGLSEAGLLEQARRVLASSPGSALALTQQHAARFPHGVLSQEREVIAVEALRRLHRTAEAEQRAAAFAKAFPGSAHQRMVEEATPK